MKTENVKSEKHDFPRYAVPCDLVEVKVTLESKSMEMRKATFQIFAADMEQAALKGRLLAQLLWENTNTNDLTITKIENLSFWKK